MIGVPAWFVGRLYEKAIQTLSLPAAISVARAGELSIDRARNNRYPEIINFHWVFRLIYQPSILGESPI